jgi:hypothetical protein
VGSEASERPPRVTTRTFSLLELSLYSSSLAAPCRCTLTPQQHLQAFYPPQSLDQVAQRVYVSGALQQLSQAWRLPTELAADLVKISLFDVVVLVDDSGSMAFEQGGERIEDLKM